MDGQAAVLRAAPDAAVPTYPPQNFAFAIPAFSQWMASPTFDER
jgi:hypothetical protein